MSMSPRLNRLFASDGRCFDVAIDHGFFNERRFLDGIEDISDAIATVVDAAPDAIQLTPGQSRVLQRREGQKPALVFRTDVANVYGRELPDYLFSELIDRPVERALRLDAACVVVNLLRLPGEPDLYHQCIQNVSELRPKCEDCSMPLMVEPLVFQPNDEKGGYMVDGDIDKIMPLVRQAAELGADVIKADPTDEVGDYHRVVEVASGIPVLVRGGGKVSDEAILRRTARLMDQGAAGIVYGRNVIHHEHPDRMTRALMAVVHEGAAVEDALGHLRG